MAAAGASFGRRYRSLLTATGAQPRLRALEKKRMRDSARWFAKALARACSACASDGAGPHVETVPMPVKREGPKEPGLQWQRTFLPPIAARINRDLAGGQGTRLLSDEEVLGLMDLCPFCDRGLGVQPYSSVLRPLYAARVGGV